MLEKLQEALQNMNTVVLPDFGGFLKVGDRVMFNAFLKYNDGKFIRFLVQNHGYTEDEALVDIRQLVADIKVAVSLGGCDLGDIGLLKEIDGKLMVIASEKRGDKSEEVSFSKSEVLNEVKSEDTKEVNEKDKGIVPGVLEGDVNQSFKSISEFDKPKTSVDFTIDEALVKLNAFNDKIDLIAFCKGERRCEIIDELNIRLSELNSPSIENVRIKLTDPFEKAANAQPISDANIVLESGKVAEEQVSPEENKGYVKKLNWRKYLRWTGVLLMLNGSLTLLYLNKNRVYMWFSDDMSTTAKRTADQKLPKKKEIIRNDKVANDSINPSVGYIQKDVVAKPIDPLEINGELQPDRIEVELEEKPKERKVEQYHIMVGSFSTTDYANNLIGELHKKGYTDAGILGEFNELISVKIASFRTREEAIKFQDKMKRDDLQGWIKKY